MKPHFQQVRRRKGQSLIEFAFGAIILVMLLAAAVDFGRAFYTYTVVLNMAGEGAAILAESPDADLDEAPLPPNISVDDTYQMRARAVAARVMGVVINPNNVDLARGDVTVTDLRGLPMPPENRCVRTRFEVHVRYRMDDLFFPVLLGFHELDIGATAPNSFSIRSQRSHCTS